MVWPGPAGRGVLARPRPEVHGRFGQRTFSEGELFTLRAQLVELLAEALQRSHLFRQQIGILAICDAY
jgi:hypothetical protein